MSLFRTLTGWLVRLGLLRPAPVPPRHPTPEAAPTPKGSVRQQLDRLRAEQKTLLDEARHTFLITLDDKLLALTPHDLLKAYKEKAERDPSTDAVSIYIDWPKLYWEMGFASEKDLDAQLQNLAGFKKAQQMALAQGFKSASVLAFRSGTKTTVAFRVSYAAY